jgi:hypothetical protein
MALYPHTIPRSVALVRLLAHPPNALLPLVDSSVPYSPPTEDAILHVIRAIPLRLPVHSGTIRKFMQDLETRENNDPFLRDRVPALFVLAYISDEAAFGNWSPPTCSTERTFRPVKENILANPASAKNTLVKVVYALAMYEYTMRLKVMRCRFLPFLSYGYRMRDTVLLFLGHYSKEWVHAFRRAMGLGSGPDPSLGSAPGLDPSKGPKHRPNQNQKQGRIDKAIEWVREDIMMYCMILRQAHLPAHHPYFHRFITRYRGSTIESMTVADAQQALAFCSRYPVMIWIAMGWTVSRKDRETLTQMASEGFGPSIHEAVDICVHSI